MTAERKEGKGKTEEQMPLEQVTAELWIQSRWKEHWGHREAKGWPLYWAPGPGMPPQNSNNYPTRTNTCYLCILESPKLFFFF